MNRARLLTIGLVLLGSARLTSAGDLPARLHTELAEYRRQLDVVRRENGGTRPLSFPGPGDRHSCLSAHLSNLLDGQTGMSVPPGKIRKPVCNPSGNRPHRPGAGSSSTPA